MSATGMLARRQVRRAPGRVAAIFIAALLSAMALMATGTFIGTMNAGIRVQIAAPLSQADVIVEAHSEDVTAERLTDVDGVAAAEPSLNSGARVTFAGDQHDVPLIAAPHDEQLRWFDIAEGTVPSGLDQVAVSTETLDKFGLALGDTVQLDPYTADPYTATIVGALDLPAGIESGTPLYVDGFSYADQSWVSLVRADAGMSAEDLILNIDNAFPPLAGDNPQLEASVGADYLAGLIDQATGGTNILAMIFLIFAAIALLAAAMVIRNTFQVLLAQRLRETGLLRLIGADGRQVQRTVLAEATIVGTAGALAGVAAGFGLGVLIAALLSLTAGGLVFPIGWMIAAIVTTVLMTVLAAWAPSVSARKLAPIAALSSAATTERITARASRSGWVIGLFVTLAGAVALTYAAISHSLPLALGGGIIAAIGLIVLVPLLVRVITPGVAWMIAGLGPITKLAGENLVRTARRSGTVVLAIALGGSLVLSMLTAVASVRATLESELDEAYPVDVVIVNKDGSELTERQLRAIELLPNTELVTTVRGLEVESDIATATDGYLPEFAHIYELPESYADRAKTTLSANTLLMSEDAVGPDGAVANGTEINVRTMGGSQQTMTLSGDALAQTMGQRVGGPLASAEAFAALGGSPATTAAWIEVTAGKSTELTNDLNELVTNDTQLTYDGAVSMRALYEEITNFVVFFVLAMLGLTIVISVIGLANVVALSVAERRREIALLRALGTSRGSVRTMVMIESIALALIGAVLSIVIGVPLGIAAASSAMVSETISVVVALPWLEIGLVVATAIVLGLAAGLGPALRASKIAPATALARE